MEYLSDEWVGALDAALRAARLPPDSGAIEIEQVVTSVPSRGEVRYRVRIDPAGSSARRSSPDDAPPDVAFHTDYPIAVAIATGATNAQRALAEGRLRLVGAVSSLAGVAGALGVLGDVTAELRARTTHAPVGES